MGMSTPALSDNERIILDKLHKLAEKKGSKKFVITATALNVKYKKTIIKTQRVEKKFEPTRQAKLRTLHCLQAMGYIELDYNNRRRPVVTLKK